MREEQGVSGIQSLYLCHFLTGQGKVKNVQILLHPLLMCGFGDHNDPALDQEAKSHLGRRFIIAAADAEQSRIGKETVFTF